MTSAPRSTSVRLAHHLLTYLALASLPSFAPLRCAEAFTGSHTLPIASLSGPFSAIHVSSLCRGARPCPSAHVAPLLSDSHPRGGGGGGGRYRLPSLSAAKKNDASAGPPPPPPPSDADALKAARDLAAVAMVLNEQKAAAGAGEASAAGGGGGGARSPKAGGRSGGGRWRELPVRVRAALAAVLLQIKALVSRRRYGGSLTPGRGGGGGPLGILRASVRSLRAQSMAQRVRSLCLALFLFSLTRSLTPSGDNAARAPPPREVHFSEFLRVVEKKPEALVGPVLMGANRWDFTLHMPVTEPQTATTTATPDDGGGKAAATEAAALEAVAAGGASESAAMPTETPAEAVRLFTRPVGQATGGVDPMVMALLRANDVAFGAKKTSSALTLLLRLGFPCLYLYFVWSMMTKMGKGPDTGGVGKKLKAGLLPASAGFNQVAGLGPAKREVSEVVEMLRSPERYAKMGARLPTGILLVGPPGTGKTLLARAVAAEARVPFFYCSGSDFVEMFVGRGAARVRSLFNDAKKSAGPAIVFVDELDAIGKARSMAPSMPGLGGGSGEAEQTLNQLLACMDGVDTSNDGVVVIAATNRYSLLDEALTRPGRFDRVVKVNLPDEEGRRAILGVHTRELELGADKEATLALAAAITPGASGAELAALVNEAAIRAVRRGGGTVEGSDFADAVASFNEARRGGAGGMGSNAVQGILKDYFGRLAKG